MKVDEGRRFDARGLPRRAPRAARRLCAARPARRAREKIPERAILADPPGALPCRAANPRHFAAQCAVASRMPRRPARHAGRPGPPALRTGSATR
ncbi:hypothetical protein Y024_5632 [Burkholderia pseudomallei TSV44]|nr:hypothetical protein Y024_5632 [Burkholderia pseudomallei TSV44]